MQQESKNILTAKEAGKVLNLSDRTVRQYAQENAFPGAVRDKKSWKIPVEAVENYKNNREHKNACNL